MQIPFDNSVRLPKNVYYFEYKGTRFKLIQSRAKKWSDALLSIVDNDWDEKAKHHVYKMAAEFLSALSWENNARVMIGYYGGGGIRSGFTLRKAKVPCRSFEATSFRSCSIGCHIQRIPHIETQDQNNALSLFREAKSINNFYLAFIYFWQVIEIGRGTGGAIGWINKAWRKKRRKIYLGKDALKQAGLKSSKIGKDLYQNRRCAIAHIYSRKPGKTHISIDDPKDKIRMSYSTRIVSQLAQLYITESLKLTKKMYLVRKKAGAFPAFFPEDKTIVCNGIRQFNRFLQIDLHRKK